MSTTLRRDSLRAYFVSLLIDGTISASSPLPETVHKVAAAVAEDVPAVAKEMISMGINQTMARASEKLDEAIAKLGADIRRQGLAAAFHKFWAGVQKEYAAGVEAKHGKKS